MVATLADYLSSRRWLTPGQIVTVGVSVARELAALHANGRVSAAVSAQTIRIDAEGRPSLVPSAGGSGDPREDLRALAGVLRAAAGPDAGLALVRVLGATADAATFARDLYAVCPPAPLLAGRTGLSQPARSVRRSGLAAVLGATVVLASLAGVAWARSSGPRVRSAPMFAANPRQPVTRHPSQPDWWSAMVHLDAQRNAAFDDADPAELAAVYVPHSVALARDTAALRALVVHHAHTRGLRFLIASVELRTGTSTVAVLRVVDRMPSYDVVSGNRVLVHHAARGVRAWQVRLHRVGETWRIAAVT